jgi:hypothetical protein
MKRKDISKSKTLKTAHTSNSKSGSGDYYGTGVRNKVGIPREVTLTPSFSKKQLGKPPKSLA